MTTAALPLPGMSHAWYWPTDTGRAPVSDAAGVPAGASSIRMQWGESVAATASSAGTRGRGTAAAGDTAESAAEAAAVQAGAVAAATWYCWGSFRVKVA